MKGLIAVLLTTSLFCSCASTKNAAKKNDDRIEINFLLINDVYEIAPLAGGKEGGVARVATLKKQYLQNNPNTFLVIAGDFLSPSVYNSVPYEGKPIRGRQMIEALNTAGVDFAIFGNHEFDIKENELQERINESGFQWISSNTFYQKDLKAYPFAKKGGSQFPKTYIMKVKDADGTEAKIGFIALCLPFNKADYVAYSDPLETAKNLYGQIKDSVDAVVAITHQSMEDDEILAKEIPGIALILGGHEHDQRFKKTGRRYIVKALANAKSVYAVEMKINVKKKKVKIDPDLEIVDERIPLDSATNAVVQKWTSIADKNFASLGFDAKRVVVSSGEALDGRESIIRSQPTNLTKLIAKSMKAAVPSADVVLFNAGSVRVDDLLTMPVTEYDIIRTLPFGGGINQVDMKGSLLIKVLEQGKKNAGTGGFVIHNDEVIADASGKWLLNNAAIEADKIYHVAVSDFLISGKEVNFDFFTVKHPGIVKVFESPKANSDIRLVLIRYLEKQ